MAGQEMGMTETDASDMQFIGMYLSYHPGMEYLLDGTDPDDRRWWAVVLHQGKRINYFRIEIHAQHFWYPAGALGFNSAHVLSNFKPLDKEDVISTITPVLELLRKHFLFTMLEHEHYVTRLDHTPLNWLDGLWFLNANVRRALCGTTRLRTVKMARKSRQRYNHTFGRMLREFAEMHASPLPKRMRIGE